DTPKEPPPQPSPDPEQLKRAEKAKATLAAWNRLRAVLADLGKKVEPLGAKPTSANEYSQNLTAASACFNRASMDVGAIDVSGADADFASFVGATSEYFHTCGASLAEMAEQVMTIQKFKEFADSPALGMESFLRGFFGDPFGTTNDLRARA